MPAIPPTVSRRTLLRWSSAALGGVGVLGAAGCAITDDDSEPEPDPLIAQAARARAEAATATALVALHPDRAEALTTIGTERAEHAQVLDAEVARLAGTTPTDPSSAATTTAAATGEQPTVELLREGLQRSQRSAADLARILQGYRSGLLASISAACAVETAVLLP
ncbi:hypothetical protein [Rhodococcus chondri]